MHQLLKHLWHPEFCYAKACAVLLSWLCTSVHCTQDGYETRASKDDESQVCTVYTYVKTVCNIFVNEHHFARIRPQNSDHHCQCALDNHCCDGPWSNSKRPC